MSSEISASFNSVADSCYKADRLPYEYLRAYAKSYNSSLQVTTERTSSYKDSTHASRYNGKQYGVFVRFGTLQL